jgi:hypothetical protein
MAFNGSGTFNRIYNWVTDKANGFKITASRMDGEFDGIATGLSQCITKDGQTTITANIPFNNNKITGLGNGTARTDVINVGQVQDNQFQYLGTTGGTADAYTLTPSPSIIAYATTQQITAKINAINLTTTPYLQISGIANPATTAVIKKLSATKTEIAVEASDLLINGIYHFQRNSANDAWIILNPEKGYFNLINATKASTTNQGVAYLNNPITIANNASDANNDIDFSAGNAPLDDGSGQVLLSSTLVKRLDASWVAGTNQGGLFSGTKANSTKYYLFAITNGTINDAGFDISPTGANIPAGYKESYRGAVLTDGSGNIRPFTLAGQYMSYVNEITDYTPTSPTSGVYQTYSLSCPSKPNILAYIRMTMVYTGAGVVAQDFNYRNTGQSGGNFFGGGAINGYQAQNPTGFVPLNSLAQVDLAFTYTAPSSNFAILTKGYFDFNIKL